MEEPKAEDPGGSVAGKPSAASAEESVRSRFATPVEATQPVNADEQSDEAFTPVPPAEDKARSGTAS